MTEDTQPKIDELLLVCSSEPIHKPGSIQGNGALIAIRRADSAVHCVSDNFSSYLGLDAVILPGTAAQDIQLLNRLALNCRHQDWASLSRELDAEEIRTVISDLRLWSRDLFCHIIKQKEFIVIEFELANATSHGEVVSSVLADTTSRILNETSVQGACKVFCSLTRRVTDFDRVMAYRFDSHCNGEVIAEAHSDLLFERFLGHKFPSHDIPQQARDLYLVKPSRQIADVDGNPIALIYDDGRLLDHELDLSLSDLRSASPVHCQYLRNMGVKATFVLSLIVSGRLWGLIACHHYSEKNLNPKTRAVLTLALHVLSAHIVSLRERQKHLRETQARSYFRAIRGQLLTKGSIDAAANEAARALVDLSNSSASIISHKGVIGRYELHTSEKELPILFKLFESIAGDGALVCDFNLDQVDKQNPTIAGQLAEQGFYGFAFLQLGTSTAALVLRRRKMIPTIWGGDPHEVAKVVENGCLRLFPRSSFAAWVSETEFESEEWEDEDQASLSVAIEEVRELIASLQERDRIEKELALSAILTNMQESVLITDELGRTRWVNDAMTRLSGFNLEDLLGKKPGDLLQGPDTDPVVVKRMSDAIQHQARFHERVLNYSKQGFPYWVEIRCSPIQAQDGVARGFVAVELDVTREMQLQTEVDENREAIEQALTAATQALEARNTFLATMSHELRTPLNAVIGFSEVITKEMLGPLGEPRYVNYANDILASGRHLLSIINDILDYARIDADKHDLTIDSIDVSDVANEAIAMVRSSIISKHQQLVLRFDESPLVVFGHRRSLIQVMTNILSNASKYSYEEQTIELSVSRLSLPEGERIEISVVDSGVGIPAEALARLGEPFFQVGNAYSRQQGGSGLGIAIVRKLVEAMKGTLLITSKINEGTHVRILLRVGKL